jgi:hypothetical protein
MVKAKYEGQKLIRMGKVEYRKSVIRTEKLNVEEYEGNIESQS